MLTDLLAAADFSGLVDGSKTAMITLIAIPIGFAVFHLVRKVINQGK